MKKITSDLLQILNIKRLICLLSIVCIMVTSSPVSILAKDPIGSRIEVEKVEGDVSIVKSTGKSVKASVGVKLAASESLRTQAKSYAYIAIDNDKVIKLDELTDVNVKKSGKKLSVEVNEGSIFFEVKEKLDNSETMNLGAASMAMSIRGTAGVIGVRRVEDNIVTSVELVDGRVDMTYDDVTGKDHAFVLEGGQSSVHSDGSDSVSHDEIDEKEFPGFAAVEFEGNPELCEKIKESNGLDTEYIIKHAKELLAAEQKYNAKNYSDVFEEGNTSSVKSRQEEIGTFVNTSSEVNVSKFLKRFWAPSKKLVPTRTGVITPTPLPSQKPVKTITLTPTPTVVPNNNGNGSESGSNNNQSSTMIITGSGNPVGPTGIDLAGLMPKSSTSRPSASTPSGGNNSSNSNSEPSNEEPDSEYERMKRAFELAKILSELNKRKEEEEKIKYTVTFYAHDERTVLKTQEVVEGESATPPAEIPIVDGYTFSHWGGDYTNIISDMKIYAIYSKKDYNVYFWDQKSDTPTSPYYEVEHVLYDNTVTPPSSPNHEGMTFVGWAIDPQSTQTVSVENNPIVNETNYYAVYNAKQIYTVSFVAVFTDGSGEERFGVREVEEGYVLREEDIPTLPEYASYSFVEWETSPYNVTINSDVSFRALYEKNAEPERDKFVVTFYDDGNVIDSVSVYRGEMATPPEAPTKQGYRFERWDGRYEDVQQDESVFAVYQKE